MLVKKTASCLEMLQWFEAKGRIVQTPLPGDLVFFKYSTNARRTNHIGLVYSIKSKDNFQSIEGNTSINSNDNGGSVMLRNRTNKNVVAFARPNYTLSQLQKILDIANGEIGTKESPPNSNNVKYNTWFYGRQVSGANYPWCCAFISYIFNLLENGESPMPTTYPTLKTGSKGPYVKVLQELLNKKGYNLTVDGDFGTLTKASVMNYQRVKNLEADGIVGPKTWEALLK